jgi:hypothetical protein
MKNINFDLIFKISVLALLIAILFLILHPEPVKQSRIGKYKEFKDEHGLSLILNTETGNISSAN